MNINGEQMLLYAVTGGCYGDRSLVSAVEEAVEAGVTLVQYRDKRLSHEEQTAEAMRLHEVTRRYEVPLIINDNIAVAMRVGAEGVHLGQEDTTLSCARQQLGPNKIIGVTVHSVTEALAAEKAGADYLGAGAIYSSTTKRDTIPMSIEELSEICRAVTIPVVAIGGITRDNISLLEGSGISGVAVVSAIFAAENIEYATCELKSLARRITRRRE